MATNIVGATGIDKVQDGIIVNADIDTVAASKLTGALPAISAANLTAIPAGNLTGTVADARISALTSSKLTGALPAISGASLTNLPATDISGKLNLSGGAMTGAITTNSTFDGVDIATRDAVLTSTTTTAGAALPKAGGTMTGTITSTAAASIQLTNDTQNQINFGDSADDNAGAIRYNHSLNKLSIRCAGDDNCIQILGDRTVLIGSDSQTPEMPSAYDATQMSIVNNHSDGYCLTMHNEGNNQDRRGMMIACGYRNASGTNRPLDFLDGDGTLQGSITFAQGTVSYGAFTANHDVELPNADNDVGYSYGTLVEISELFYKASSGGTPFERGIRYKVQKSSSAYSKSVLGAYAGKYHDNANLHQAYVLGDGHILCNSEKGNIAVGDGICTSSTDGIGMKADKTAMIIGIAQEDISFSGGESKLVAVQYGLQQFTPWE